MQPIKWYVWEWHEQNLPYQVFESAERCQGGFDVLITIIGSGNGDPHDIVECDVQNNIHWAINTRIIWRVEDWLENFSQM